MRTWTTGILPDALLELNGQQLPLRVVHVVIQIDRIQRTLEVHRLRRIDPGAEPKDAVLIVERKIRDVHVTGALQFHGHWPRDRAIAVDDNVDAIHEAC